MSRISNRAVALGLAGAMAASVPAFAAPVMSSAATLKQAGTSDVIQVRRWGRAAAAAGIGLAAGAIIGSMANQGYYGGYYGGPYAYGYAPYSYYGGPVYAAPAPVYRYSAPAYVGPSSRTGSCWITTGGDGRYGYWAAC